MNVKLNVIFNIVLFILTIISCTNKSSEKNSTKINYLQFQPIYNIKDTNIINKTDKTIDILYNGINNYLGGKHNLKIHFSTECMICENIQTYKNGFIFGKKLYVTKDSIKYLHDKSIITDSTKNIKKITMYGIENKTLEIFFSQGKLKFTNQGYSCNDSEYFTVKLFFKKGTITFKKLINATFFEYDLDKNGINEQYLIGSRNCTQELVLLRINE